MTGRLTIAALTVTLLSACGNGGQTAADDTSPQPAVSPPPTATATASPTPATGCAGTEFPSLQEGGHLLEGADPPVPYSSTPGTSGWHAGGAPQTGVFGPDEELSEPRIVLALEVGQMVASYDPATLGADEVTELEQLAATEHEGTLTVTPFTARDQGAPLVLNGWGVRQACQEVDADVIASFIEAHLPSAPGHG
ncbi:MAG: DUF3105 domain-containing protein [Actinobacteria bacterium]|nr:DUF3105 domain-containing protein [Actinomycetota bacterium]